MIKPFIPNLCPEAELLLYSARPHLDSETIERITALLQQELNWDYLLQLTERHAVMPLLYRTLQQVGMDSIAPSYQQRLQDAYQTSIYRNLALTQELVRLLDQLATQAIPVLSFKGPILALALYGDLSRRWISDLDLLVDQADFDRVKQWLIEQGYCPQEQVRWECQLVRADGMNVDLHQEAVPLHLCHPLTNAYWWSQVQPCTLAGKTIPSLTPIATLLMLCLNGTKDRWLGLNRLCDVAAFLHTYPTLDWPVVIQQVEAIGLRRLVALAFWLAHRLLEAPLPDSLATWIAADPIVPRLGQQVAQELFSDRPKPYREVLRTVFHIRTRERLSDRLYSFWELLKYSGWLTPTAKDRAFLPLPAALSWLYVIIRPIRVIGRYGLSPLHQLFWGR